MPANFRTEEGMRRLLTAVMAAHDIKLNYKDIAAYFGESTPDGIQWQFRQIKRDAEAMRQGGKGAPDGGSTPSATPMATPKSGRKRSAASAPSTGKSTARAKKARGSAAKPVESHVINLDDDDSEHSPIQTPTKARRFTVDLDQEREIYARGGVDYDTGAPLAAAAGGGANAAGAPALSLPRSDSPGADEDVKPPTTPRDSASYSFAQPAHSHAQHPDGWDNFSRSSFATLGGNSKSYVADEYDDDLSV